MIDVFHAGNDLDVADDMVQVSYLDETTQQDVYADYDQIAVPTRSVEMSNPDDASDVWGLSQPPLRSMMAFETFDPTLWMQLY